MSRSVRPAADRPARPTISVARQPMETKVTDELKALIAISATRQMVSEICFDELLRLLVESGATTPNRAAIMLDRLRSRIVDDTARHNIHEEHELADQAARIGAIAAEYKARRPGLVQ